MVSPAADRALFTLLCRDSCREGREILITGWDLWKVYLTAAFPGPDCSWSKQVGKMDYGAFLVWLQFYILLLSLRKRTSPPAQATATGVIEAGHEYLMVLMILSFFFPFNWTNKVHLQWWLDITVLSSRHWWAGVPAWEMNSCIVIMGCGDFLRGCMSRDHLSTAFCGDRPRPKRRMEGIQRERPSQL